MILKRGAHPRRDTLQKIKGKISSVQHEVNRPSVNLDLALV